MSFRTLGYNFYTNPFKYTRYFAREYPSYFWSVVIGVVAPVGISSYPYVREWWGLDTSRPNYPPSNYPLSRGPRQKLSGYDDPPISKPEPTWYLHPPPDYVRQAAEEKGLKWSEVLKDLEQRRDAMVDGEEWDVDFEGSRIVWDKPTMERLKQSFEEHEKFKSWGQGWRKWIIWGMWKIMGSPEGVFETVDGKVDGKLVLRELEKSKVRKTPMTAEKPNEEGNGEEKKP